MWVIQYVLTIIFLALSLDSFKMNIVISILQMMKTEAEGS